MVKIRLLLKPAHTGFIEVAGQYQRVGVTGEAEGEKITAAQRVRLLDFLQGSELLDRAGGQGLELITSVHTMVATSGGAQLLSRLSCTLVPAVLRVLIKMKQWENDTMAKTLALVLPDSEQATFPVKPVKVHGLYMQGNTLKSSLPDGKVQ
jgi:hypothetical protein